MMERSMQEYEDCNLYAGDLDEETAFLMKEGSASALYTDSTPYLTIFCC